ncbi:methyltransferase small domain superfamily protein [Streptococcus pneumoniae]|nr:methyltransferase small domain superfamily protein [Streptococcus pneumoniae]
MKHDFNHKAETFDSPKNIFLANLVCQAAEKQIDLLSDKEILDFGGGIDLLSDKEILDFGGGTGLLALPLTPSQAG